MCHRYELTASLCLATLAVEIMLRVATLESKLLGGLMDVVLTRTPREKENETRANERDESCLM